MADCEGQWAWARRKTWGRRGVYGEQEREDWLQQKMYSLGQKAVRKKEDKEAELYQVPKQRSEITFLK